MLASFSSVAVVLITLDVEEDFSVLKTTVLFKTYLKKRSDYRNGF